MATTAARRWLQSTPAWRALRAAKRRAAPPRPDALLPPEQTRGQLAFLEPPPALEPGRTHPWKLRVLNQSGEAWPAGAVGVSLQWATHAGDRFGDARLVPLPAPAYPGEPLEVAAPFAAPAFVGDFVLSATLTRRGESFEQTPPATVAVPVTGPRGTDIDYHAVYRTADLQSNHWWVVGAYHSRDEYEKSQAGRKKMLVEDFGLLPTSRVLDVGCGTGQMADALRGTLAPSGAYYGTDIGKEAIDFCHAQNHPANHVFAVGGMTEIPFGPADAPFDIAIYFSVFTHTHLDEAVLLLAQTRDLLGPGGRVAVDVITSPLVEREQGHRGEMVVNRAYFERLAAAVGFSASVVAKWRWNPHAERIMYRLEKR